MKLDDQGAESGSGSPEIEQLQRRLRDFARRRAWERFHTAKNLTTAIAGEAGELAAVLQWATPDQDLSPFMNQLEDEIADVFIYLLQLCDVIDVDPLQTAHAKVDKNEQRFPTSGPNTSGTRTRREAVDP
jgi:NTP pyrophosphatase (non-canonical NTP hydrolase)